MPAETTTAAEPLTHGHARELFQRAYELLNEHDPAHIPTIFTEDVVFEDDAWQDTIRGHADMERFLRTTWRAFPDLRFELLEGPYLSEDGRGAAAHVQIGGTMTGPLDPPGLAPTGTRMKSDYGGFYEFDGDRIRRARIIINMNATGSQLGAVPAPGSRGERLGVMLQRLQARRMRGRGSSG
jgi:steroid delta-isomerase-like uncharacterized protein